LVPVRCLDVSVRSFFFMFKIFPVLRTSGSPPPVTFVTEHPCAHGTRFWTLLLAVSGQSTRGALFFLGRRTVFLLKVLFKDCVTVALSPLSARIPFPPPPMSPPRLVFFCLSSLRSPYVFFFGHPYAHLSSFHLQ